MGNKLTEDNIATLPQLSTEYMNNTKVMQCIIDDTSVVGATMKVATVTNRRSKAKVCAIVNVTLDDTVAETRGKMITHFDRSVMDAVYTLLSLGRTNFTAENIARVLCGRTDRGYKASKDRLSTIEKSLQKLSQIRVKINCTDELIARAIIDKDHKSVILTTYLLPLTEIEVTTGNHVVLHGYHLIEKPALYHYAELINQIITFPAELLLCSKEIRNTEEVVVIKRELIRRIEIMANPKNRVSNCYICYEWHDISSKQERGFLRAIGLNSASYTNKSWRNKKNHVHHIVCNILSQFKECHYIADYEECKKGKQKVTGVLIKLP